MADKSKLEQMLEKLVNNDRDGADALFHEFVIEKSWITKNPFEVEQKIFYSLADYRQGNSEFFKCTLKRIFSTVERHLQKLD